MRNYRTLQPLKLGKGTILQLTDDQAATRKTILQPVGDGRYESLAETQWIAGETIGLDCEVTPALAEKLELADEQPVEGEQKRKGGRPRK